MFGQREIPSAERPEVIESGGHRNKWNRRYQERQLDSFQPEPHPMVEPFRARLTGGRMLDAACGLGRGIATAGDRFETVFAVDISDVAVMMARSHWKGHPGIQWIIGDVTSMAWPKDFFGLVCAFGFTDVPFFKRVQTAIHKGGMFLYEGFSRRQLEVKPELSPDWTMTLDEAARLFESWEILLLEESTEAPYRIRLAAVRENQ